jgi:3-oxoacyl-[acyl-carrier-protein] synthase II
MNNKRIVITGIGVIAPNGIGKEAFWHALEEGRSGIKPTTIIDTT